MRGVRKGNWGRQDHDTLRKYIKCIIRDKISFKTLKCIQIFTGLFFQLFYKFKNFKSENLS